MTLPLTSEMLAAAYDYLRATPPFNKWNLPEPEDVKFRVVRNPSIRGHYRRDQLDRPEIAISARSIGYTGNLMEVMSHEMIHLHQDRLKILYNNGSEHSAFFRKEAARVCKFHGFDPKLFY